MPVNDGHKPRRAAAPTEAAGRGQKRGSPAAQKRPQPRPSWRVWRRPVARDGWDKDLADLEPLPEVQIPKTYRQATEPQPLDMMQYHCRRLLYLEATLPEYDPFCYLPTIGWLVFTMLAAGFHGEFVAAAVLLMAGGAFTGMVFSMGHTLRTLNIALGFTVCIFGIVLLGVVGQVGFQDLGHVLSWMFPSRHSARGPMPSTGEFALAVPTLAMLILSGYCGYILWGYQGVMREIGELRDKLLDETTDI